MKRVLILFLFIISVPAFSQTNSLPKKLALIVAVGQYPEGSGWPAIASINDIKYVKGALINKGFKEKDIDTLKNSKATKAAILKAMDNLAKKSAANDIVVIHFSCHGQQIQDQATEAEGKDEADGYDEAVIPVDAEAMYNPSGYDGSKHLRDDDLAIKFKAIRNKIKPNGTLLVLIDACHSGTASRAVDASVSRGTPIPFTFGKYQPNTQLQMNSGAGDEESFIGDGTDTLSNMVVISASAAHQQNFQLWDDKGADVGSLSFAFAKAMADVKPGDDYELLFEKIKARIQAGIPTQIPMIEGNLTQQIFEGKFNKPSDDIVLTIAKTDKQAKEDSVFVINKGALDNISKGSTCKIFVAGSKEPIAEGTIVTVGSFQSAGVTKKLLKKEVAYRAVMDQISFGDFSTSVAVNEKGTNSHQLKSQVASLFQPYQFISLKNNADLMLNINEQNAKVRMELFDRGDSTRWVKELSASDTLSAADKEELIASIKNSTRVKYLRSLPDGGDLSKNLIAQLIPQHISSTVNPNGEMEFKPGDTFTMNVTNDSKENLFFSIVDIMPNNEMQVLIPTPKREPGDYELGPKETRSFTIGVDANTPSGREVYKVFITREAIDLRKLFDRKNKAAHRAISMSLEDMINDTFKDSGDAAATRSVVSNVKLDEAGILTVGFIVKKQNP
ncbi:MAG: caspase family protein [Sphingobacteriales bacterium]|nr:caspase family protein [Sphingobacteriales bacterium]